MFYNKFRILLLSINLTIIFAIEFTDINNGYIDREKFIGWLKSSIYDVKIRTDQKINISYKWNSIEERLDILEDITLQIKNLIDN